MPLSTRMGPSSGPLPAMDYVKGTHDKVPDMCARRGLGLSILFSTSDWHPSPKIRVSTVCPEAGREATRSSFEPAKALVRGLPLPRPPSFQTHVGCLPVLRPIRVVGSSSNSRSYTQGATSDRLVAGAKDASGGGGFSLGHL
jgi:hypothetical protein